MTSIGVLHPGQMGAVVAATFAECGHEVSGVQQSGVRVRR